MNTKKNNNLRGVVVYLCLILAVVFIWYMLKGTSTTNSYTKADFLEALEKNEVESVKVVQNREIPTGSLIISMKDKNKESKTLYVSDVNEAAKEMDKAGFEQYTLVEVTSIFTCIWCSIYPVFDFE